MSTIDRMVHQRPTLVAAIICVVVILPVWWLTGSFSPLP